MWICAGGWIKVLLPSAVSTQPFLSPLHAFRDMASSFRNSAKKYIELSKEKKFYVKMYNIFSK